MRLGALPLGKLGTVIRQHSMNAVKQLLQRVFKKLGCLFPLRLAIEPSMNKVGGSVDSDEQMGLTFPGMDATNIHMQVDDRIRLEGGLAMLLVSRCAWQSADVMTLIQPVQA